MGVPHAARESCLGVGRLQLHYVGLHQVSLSRSGGPSCGPALAVKSTVLRNPSRLLNLVITQGTPPRLEGCRPASRGLTLALMTDTKT